MRITKRLLITLILLVTGINAQPIPAEKTEVVYPEAYSFYTGQGAGALQFHDSLYGISYRPNSNSYSLTTDGGTSWREGKGNGLISGFRKMFMMGRDTLVAVRDSNLILHSFNAGETWSVGGSLWSGETMNNFHFFNSRYGVNFMTATEYMVSSDRGATWSSYQWPYRAVKPSIFYNNGCLFAIEVQQSPNPASVLYSTNNGFTWQRIVLPSTIYDYTFVARGSSGFIIGTYNGIIYLVSEEGQILKRLTSPGQANAPGYAYKSDSEIWAIDTDLGSYLKGLSLYSVTDSTTSYKVINFPQNRYDNIQATTWDKLVIGAGGSTASAASLVFHMKGTRDTKVEKLKIPGVADAFVIYFINEATGFIATTANTILKTTDGGNSWAATQTPAGLPAIQGFAQKSESEFIAFCDGGIVLESGDQGNNWTALETAFKGSIRRVTFAGRDTIFFCSRDSMYITNPSWNPVTPLNTGLSDGTFRDLEIYNGSSGSATYLPVSGTTSWAMVTSDRGKTWEKKTFTGWMYTLDPAIHGTVHIPSFGLSAWSDGSTGRTIYTSSSPDHYDQNSFGNAAVTSGDKNIFFNLGKKGNFRHLYLEDGVNRQAVAVAGTNTVYMLASGGNIWKVSPSNDSPPPAAITRTYPVDGSPYEWHDLTFNWQEPWTVAPVTGYHFQLALDDTSNIVSDIQGFDSTSITLNLTADSARYYWRVRAANRYGWGRFNHWYSFKSSTVALQPKLYTTPLRGDLTAAIILPGGRLVVANNYGEIARTDQLPGNWTTVASGTVYPVNRFYYDPNNNLTCYLTGGNFLGYSSNRGFSFSRKEAPLGSTMITSIAALSPNLLFASGAYGSIFRATAGVSSWSNVWFAPNAGTFKHIATYESSGVAAVGEYGNITISSDGGQTFRYITHNQVEMYKAVSFAPDGSVVVLNQRGERRVSTDMGNTWSFELNYIRTPVRDMVSQRGISVVIDTVGGVFTSTSPTAPWRYIKLPQGTSPMGAEVSGDTILITARGNKLFYLSLYSGNITGVKEVAEVNSFSLGLNYPNPFNASTVIEFTIDEPGDYALDVFSTLGEKVATLHNGWIGNGKFSKHFNPGNLPSGIYLYRLSGNGKAITNKMIIMK